VPAFDKPRPPGHIRDKNTTWVNGWYDPNQYALAGQTKEFIFGILFIKRLSDEFDYKREKLRKEDYAHLKNQPALLKEPLEEKTAMTNPTTVSG